MKRFNSIGFKESIRIIILIIVSVLTLTYIIYTTVDEYKEMNQRIDEITNRILDGRKIAVKSQVIAVIQYIDYYRNTHPDIPDSAVQQNVLEYIEKIRFNWGGYVFVNTLEGNALIFDGKIEEDHKSILDMEDIDGKNLYQPQIAAFHNPNGDYMLYKFKKLGMVDDPVDKISYLKGYHEWNWIIGAGVYLPDMSKEITQIKLSYTKSRVSELTLFVLFFLFLGIIMLFLGNFVVGRLNYELAAFKAFFKSLPKNNKALDIDDFRVKEFKSLAQNANQMLSDLNKTSEQLRRSEERYRGLIEQAGDAIFTVDEDGKLLQVNTAACKLTEYKNDELLGHNIQELFSAEELQKNPLQFQALNQGKVVVMERALITKTHKKIPIEISSRKMENNQYVSILRDISERKEAQAELSKYRNHLEELVADRTRELEEKNKELERFNELFIGREFRIHELKEKIKELEKQLKK